MAAMTEKSVSLETGIDGRALSYLSHLNYDDLKYLGKALSHLGLSLVESHENQPLICMREIISNGRNSLIETTLSQLLSLVNSAATNIDTGGQDNLDGKSFTEFRGNNLVVKKTAFSGFKDTLPLHNKSVAISLLGRDLRRLDFDSHPNEEPSVRVRRHAILFSVDPIRAIIMSTRIIIIVPPGGMDQILEIVEKYMSGWTSDQRYSKNLTENGHISFECHAYDAILATTNTLNSQEFRMINAKAQVVLSYFNTKLGAILPYAIQEEMRALKNSVFLLQSKNSALRKALTVLIDDDESMALMNLSKFRQNSDLYGYPLSQDILKQHEEIEELLESHLLDCNSLNDDLTYLMVTIENSEDLMILKLDTSRNKLLITNTTLVVYLVSISFGAYLTGIFGMNLDQTVTIQPIFGVFETIFVSSFSLIIILSAGILYYLKREYILPSEIEYHERKEKYI